MSVFGAVLACSMLLIGCPSAHTSQESGVTDDVASRGSTSRKSVDAGHRRRPDTSDASKTKGGHAASAPSHDADALDGAEDSETASRSEEGWTERLVLRHASHAAEEAPTVVVHAPPGFDPSQPLQLVLFLHGWNGCAAVLESATAIACRPQRSGAPRHRGWGLSAEHDAAGTNSLFIIPQLAFLERDGDAGRFGERGFFIAFLDELLGEPLAHRLGGRRSSRDVERVILVAHSAGFETALAILRRSGGGEMTSAVVLFDALYAAPALFADWVEGDDSRRIISLHGGSGLTGRFSRQLGRALRASLGEEAVAVDPGGSLAQAISTHRVVVQQTGVGHGAIPGHYLTEVLSGFGLQSR